MTSATDTSDRATVVRALAAVQRRLRLDRLARELLIGFSISMALPLAVALSHLFTPLAPEVLWIVAGVWLLGFGIFAGRRLSQKGSIARAAASVDARAGLEDELKSAAWFVSQPTSSPWVEAHLHRAARTADALDIATLYPRQIPRNSWTATGLLVLLVALNLVPTSWTRGWLAAKTPEGSVTRVNETERAEEIAELLDRLEMDEALTMEQRAAQLLEDLLAEVSGTDSLDQLEEVQARLDLGAGDLEGLDRSLEAMTGAMEGVTPLDEVREALENEDLEEAADKLRELAENLEDATSDPDSREQLQEGLERAAQQAGQQLEELGEALERSAEQLEEENLEAAKEALEDAASELDEAAQQQEHQELKDAARRQLQQLQETLAARRENASQPQQGGEQSSEEQAQGGSGQGQGTEQTTARQGGDDGEARRPGEGERQQGNEAAQGDQGGMPSDAPTQLGAPTELEVTLRQEVITSRQEHETELERERLIEQPSRAADSEIEYREIEPGPSYTEPEAMEHDGVPWPYRALVKRYFEAMGPRGKHD